MANRDYTTALETLFPQGGVAASEPRTFWVAVERDALRQAVSDLREKLGVRHLTTIVAEDRRDHFLLSYVFSGEVVVVLQVKVDREKPEVPSLAPVLDGALVYEREIHDLFGIVPAGHPDLRRQALPEDWPAGLYPLRKDAVIPKPTVPDAALGDPPLPPGTRTVTVPAPHLTNVTVNVRPAAAGEGKDNA